MCKLIINLILLIISTYAWGEIIQVGHNLDTGHTYYLLSSANWTASEAEAVRLGGHLVTINNREEQNWVYSTFSGGNKALWTGFYDLNRTVNSPNRPTRRAEFGWVSQEPVTFTFWGPEEPNNPRSPDPVPGEFYVHLWNPTDRLPGYWNNYSNSDTVFSRPIHGVVEIDATVNTLAVTSVTFNSATLNGTVNANRYVREATFEYGPTTTVSLSVPAIAEIVAGNEPRPVSAMITGLQPHTKYYYRVRATDTSGDDRGELMSFTTLNRAPTAEADAYTVVPGSTVTLPILNNDSDIDGDMVSLGTYSEVDPPSAGKVTKVGDTLVFAAAPGFTEASFTYTCKDAFEGISTPVTVMITAGDALLNSSEVTLEHQSFTYPVTIRASGMWSVFESLPWVTVSPLAGEGNGTVTVTILLNATKSDRSGSVMIGDVPHIITQNGVALPTLSKPIIEPDLGYVNEFAVMPPGVLGGAYSLTLPTTGFSVSYNITNMPPGLAINDSTGVISGRTTAAGTYDMTVQARNVAGSSAMLKIRIIVAPLHRGLVGTFHGFIDRHLSLNAGLGSRFELTTTTKGTFTGKLITGTTSVPFVKGQLSVDIADAHHPKATILILRKKNTPLTLNLDFAAEDEVLTGNLFDVSVNSAPVEAWRNPWSETNPAPAYYNVRHSFLLEQGDATASLPQGFGFGSFAPASSKTGAVTVSGRMADQSVFLTKTYLGRNGEVLIYQPLYNKRGSVLGKVVLTPHDAPTADHAITGMLNWWKPSPLPNSKEVIYRSGFGPLILMAEGADCPPVIPGGLILGLPGKRGQAVIQFSEGGLPGDPPTFSHGLALNNSSTKGLTNKATLNTPIPNGLKILALDAAKGVFRGEFTLPTRRKVPFSGQFVKRAGIWGGYGYFLLPEVPEGNETVTSSPRNSGKVRLSPQ